MAGDKLFEEDLALYVHALELYKSVHLVDDRMAEIARHAKEIRAAAEKAVKDAEYAIECKDADKYLGKRVKKGCNGTSEMCQTCKAKYAARRKVSTVDDTSAST
jgi:predicted membrane-bound spermidine synthase